MFSSKPPGESWKQRPRALHSDWGVLTLGSSQPRAMGTCKGRRSQHGLGKDFNSPLGPTRPTKVVGCRNVFESPTQGRRTSAPETKQRPRLVNRVCGAAGPHNRHIVHLYVCPSLVTLTVTSALRAGFRKGLDVPSPFHLNKN
jgi:hypothetical protein